MRVYTCILSLLSAVPLLTADVSPQDLPPRFLFTGRATALPGFLTPPPTNEFLLSQAIRCALNDLVVPSFCVPSCSKSHTLCPALKPATRFGGSCVSASVANPGIEFGDDSLTTQDVIYCGVERVEFLRSAFGMYDDVSAPLWRADPFYADEDLKNAAQLRGKIALVSRGSKTGEPCSFVEKAHRIERAGAVGCIVVNTEDSLIAPGDSAREGTDVNMPVVGIRRSDSEVLLDGEEATLAFQPIAALTAEQRRHLRAVAMIQDKEGRLAEFMLDDDSSSEDILQGIDVLLVEHELVRVRFGAQAANSVTLSDLEDVIDVSTVLADNLRAAVIQIAANVMILHRSNPTGPKIPLPREGEGALALSGMLEGARLTTASLDHDALIDSIPGDVTAMQGDASTP